jgi:hypothetical protein
MKSAILSVLLAFSSTAQATPTKASPQNHTWRLDVHGLSRHFDRCHSKCTKQYNEQNFGLGLAYKVNKTFDLMAGFYDNSFNVQSTYVGVNIGHTFGHFTPGIMIGGINGYTFDGLEESEFGPALLPNVSFDADRFQINVGYIPADFGGKSAVLTFRAGFRF